jgi:hypothetical protein
LNYTTDLKGKAHQVGFFLEMLAGFEEPIEKSRFSSVDPRIIDSKIQALRYPVLRKNRI